MSNEMIHRLESLRQRMRVAASGSLLGNKDAKLIAVSKGQPQYKIIQALDAGLRAFGENRVQEAAEKWPALRARYPDIALHLIGPLQTNKAKEAVALFDVIQTLDRPKLAAAIAEECAKQKRNIACFIQVNTGEEAQKSGILPKETASFVAYCRELGLDIAGLMCIPPQHEPPAQHFGLIRQLALSNRLFNLSMGMSGDFETALRFGATHIRVGTALFGERRYV